MKIAINGFGRIGRAVLRVMIKRGLLHANSNATVVAINDLTNPQALAHLLKYDSVHGVLETPIEATDDAIIVDGFEIKVFAEQDPSQLPWADLGVDIVLEATGIFRTGPSANKHIAAGAKKVIITAPGKEVDGTFVLGVNEHTYRPADHHVISGASCTTNCLAPVAKVLHEKFGIARGLMTTIHAYTNDQRILDLPHRDMRRARAAALSMIPTTTGAAKAVGLVLPELAGKLNGFSMRVPTPNVSAVDLVVELEQNTTAAEINQVLKQQSQGKLKGILEYTDLPLVSKDFNGNDHASIVDGLSTLTMEDNMAKVLIWYDNEWGYSNCMLNLALFMAAQGL